MSKLAGRSLLIGSTLVLGTALGLISYGLWQGSAPAPTSQKVSLQPRTSAVLSDQDLQALAKRERAVCIETVVQETQKALAKVKNISDQRAAAAYTQQVLQEQKARRTYCQVTYPED